MMESNFLLSVRKNYLSGEVICVPIRKKNQDPGRFFTAVNLIPALKSGNTIRIPQVIWQ
jgi:hypothetical protein